MIISSFVLDKITKTFLQSEMMNIQKQFKQCKSYLQYI
jgi:hypothetical protein